jgi:hypothetical protein
MTNQQDPAATGSSADLPEGERPITLLEALRFLADAHTRDDDQFGYAVEKYPRVDFDWDQWRYVQCWGVVRNYIAECRAARAAAHQAAQRWGVADMDAVNITDDQRAKLLSGDFESGV